MSILDDMQATKEQAERGREYVWRISANALPAVQADLKATPSFPLIPGARLLGIPWETAHDIDGWELAAIVLPPPTKRRKRT